MKPWGARGLALGVTLLADICVCTAPMASERGKDVTQYSGKMLAELDEGHCERRRVRGIHDALWTLCTMGWRPSVTMALPGEAMGQAQATESYQLSWLRPDVPRLDLRVSAYADGSGAVWVTHYAEDEARPEKIEANTLGPKELEALLPSIHASPFWGGAGGAPMGNSSAPACDGRARLILEGLRGADHRAVVTSPCGGSWVVALSQDMFKLAGSKIPGLGGAPGH